MDHGLFDILYVLAEIYSNYPYSDLPELSSAPRLETINSYDYEINMPKRVQPLPALSFISNRKECTGRRNYHMK